MVDISLKDTISEEKADAKEGAGYEMKISYDETQKLFADYKDATSQFSAIFISEPSPIPQI